MDADRFDRLTRTLTVPLSRRVTLSGLAAGVLLSLGLALDESTVLAKKKGGGGKGNGKGGKGNGKGKGNGNKNKNKKKPNCFDLIPCGDDCCARSASCCGNHCCLPFQTCCGTECCNGEETCRDGVCVSHCNDGVKNFRETGIDCGGSCRNVRKCGVGQSCDEDADCETDACVNKPGIGFVCLPCRDDFDCERQNPETRGCFENACFECASNTDCPAGKVCNPANHACVECTSDAQCGNAERPHCVAPANGECGDQPCVCRRCRTSDDCFEEGESCDETGNCIECLSDSDCSNGVCIANHCEQCREHRDCPTGQTCDRGHVCRAGTCTASQNYCDDGNTGCDGVSECICFPTLSGEPFCASGGFCFECAVDSDCDLATGEGSACIDFSSGPFCGPGSCRGCAGPCRI